jgi:hypothetical protein
MLAETRPQERIMKATTVSGALLVLAMAAGCAPDDDGMGPAQKAGKAVDEAGDKVARELRAPLEKADEAAQEARERAEEARRQLAERAEEAGKKIREATAEAGRGLEKATEKVGEKVEQAGEKMQEAAR